MNCSKCDNELTASSKARKGSRRCRECENEARRLRRLKRKPLYVQLNCAHCKSPFQFHRKKKYCSDDCCQNAQFVNHQPSTRICPCCDGGFVSKDPNKHFCSQKCRRENDALRERGDYMQKWNQRERDQITDRYLKSHIFRGIKNVPPKLLEVKRIQIKIKRHINTLQNGKV